MLGEFGMTFEVAFPIKNLSNDGKILTSDIANRLLKVLSFVKAWEVGYILAVTKLIKIGRGDINHQLNVILFPVRCQCRLFKPVDGEIMTGIVHKISNMGVFLKSGPMNMVYLSGRSMPNYHYVPGESTVFMRDDLSRIEIGVVVRYMVLAVRWTEDKFRQFRVLATINEDGLGPVSLNGLDELDF